MKNKEPRYYVAYGSNLNIQQMAYRCPTARLHSTGVIKDYELQFKGQPQSAFATIAKKIGAEVPVAVWEIQRADEYFLDRYEGYPSHYFKRDVPVTLDDGNEINAMVYIMNLKMKFGLPSTHYYRTVLQGYLDCGLNTNALSTALGESAQKYYSSAVGAPLQMQIKIPSQKNSYDEDDAEDKIEEDEETEDEEYEEEIDEDEDEDEDVDVDEEDDIDEDDDPSYFSNGMNW